MPNVVQESTNYDKFKFIDANREVVRGHVEQIKKAFEEYGNLTKVQPILVNEDLQIIDGQHRFVACRELEEPIFFTVQPGLKIFEARNMNIMHRGWTNMDYGRSYALSGDKNYQIYLKLLEQYGFPHSVTLLYAHGIEQSGLYVKFRKGSLVIEDLPAIRKRLEMLDELSEINSIMATKPYAIAILRFSKVEGYSHQQMVKKLHQMPESLKRFQNVSDAQRQLEEIYNYKMSDKNRIRLY